MWIATFLLSIIALTAEGCEFGLTQLRYRDTLQLIGCTPGSPDECSLLTGSSDARCSVDLPGSSYVCCGPTELLIKLLSGEIRLVEDVTLSQTIRPFPVPLNLVLSTPTLTSLLTSPSTASNNAFGSTTSTPYVMQQQTRIFPTFTSVSAVTSNSYPLPSSIQSFTTVRPNGPNAIQTSSAPSIALITTGDFRINGNSSWQAASTVVLVQDGPCSIIVNTGLPVQKNEIIAGLAARGIGRGVDYTVVTSAHPQFVGNLNLFPTSRLLLGWLSASWRSVEQSLLFQQDSMSLCSQNTLLIKAPGTTFDAVAVLVYGVDGMGTVAIVGDLFMYDDNLSRVDEAFVWDEVTAQKSRRRIVCLADWLVPGHGVPLPISRGTKQQAGC